MAAVISSGEELWGQDPEGKDGTSLGGSEFTGSVGHVMWGHVMRALRKMPDTWVVLSKYLLPEWLCGIRGQDRALD